MNINIRNWRSRCLASFLCLLLLGTFARANPKIYERALQSTGWVIVPSEDNSPMGTCWVVDRERKLVITSYHLVKDAEEALIYFPKQADGRLITQATKYLYDVRSVCGRVVAVDRPRDLALIQVDSLPDSAKELPMANESPRPGEDVHSIGNSGLAKTSSGMLWRYTRGNVRQVYERKVTSGESSAQVRFVETQSPVNQGDSGGPLLNDQGEVVGVIMAFDPHERLVSHNIDIHDVKLFLKNSIAKLQNAAKKSQQPAAASCAKLMGKWKLTANLDDGTTSQGEAQFKKNGTYVMSDSSEDGPMHGRFAYANGILWLMMDDSHATFKLVWSNGNRFSFASNGVEMSFER